MSWLSEAAVPSAPSASECRRCEVHPILRWLDFGLTDGVGPSGHTLTPEGGYTQYAQMSAVTARVFQSGNSQAVRLPKGYRFKSKVVRLTPMQGGVLLTDPADLARRRRALRKLWGSCPGFPGTK